MSNIEDDSLFVAKADTVSATVDGKRVLLNGETGLYHGMNNVGAELFDDLDSPKTITELTEELSSRYNIERSTARSDVRDFIESLHKAELITKTSGK